jgi:hypothetical protein
LEARFREEDRRLAAKLQGKNIREMWQVPRWLFGAVAVAAAALYHQLPTHVQGKEGRVIDELCKSIWWSTIDEDNGSNPVLAWHGTREENLPMIFSEGFKV